MSGWMDEWRNGWLDSWMAGWLDVRMAGWLAVWTNGWMDEWWKVEWMRVSGCFVWGIEWIDGWIDGWMHECVDVWMYGCVVDEWVEDGCIDGWTVEQTDGRHARTEAGRQARTHARSDGWMDWRWLWRRVLPPPAPAYYEKSPTAGRSRSRRVRRSHSPADGAHYIGQPAGRDDVNTLINNPLDGTAPWGGESGFLSASRKYRV